MTLTINDVKRFWLEHSNIIDSESELVIEIGEGKRFRYKKTPEENMYQKTGQRNLKSLEVHFSCQEKVSFRMNIN